MTNFTAGDLIHANDTVSDSIILRIVDGLAHTVNVVTGNGSTGLIVDMFDLVGIKKVGHVELTDEIIKKYEKLQKDYFALSYEEREKLNETQKVKKEVKNPKYFCTCYGEEHKFATKKDAINFFLDAYNCSDGSEAERYASILMQLDSGKKVCSDVA